MSQNDLTPTEVIQQEPLLRVSEDLVPGLAELLENTYNAFEKTVTPPSNAPDLVLNPSLTGGLQPA